MAEEEFQESEIVFPESVNYNGYAADEERSFSCDSRDSRSKKQRRRTARATTTAAAERREAISLPMNIPESWFRCVDVEPDLFGEDGEMVPPHVITGRRIARKMMSFSVCTGYGRTLKGRDLSEVRNSILRMTGFLEA